MKKLMITASIALILSACGGSTDTGTAPLVGAALPDPVDTETLVVAEDFSFATARSINIEFDIEEGRGKEAAVSVCTEYSAVDAYEVNYTSCPVKASMSDGIFSHSMEVTNAYDTVIAVVWFTDTSMEPIAREFTLEQGASTRSKNSGQNQTIVWN